VAEPTFQPEPFGKYILLEKLATGGMAEVYLAKMPGAENVSKYFAIKRILPQFSGNLEFIEMFKEEAKIAVNLSHSNVVSIYEFGELNGQFYIVMEFVGGAQPSANFKQTRKGRKKIFDRSNSLCYW
jgi:serine/threonine-protein kinase